MTAVIADATARARAIDPQTSFIVQAPAGSGKTELLIQRFLRLLATVERPGEILAITFTRKAAGEMRGRLLQALMAARGPAPEDDHKRLTWQLARAALNRDAQFGWQLLDNPTLLGIQTIDSFNASLVRCMPWLSRFGAVPEIAEDARPLYREAARRLLRRLDEGGPGSSQVAQVLVHLDNRMDLLEGLLIGMLARRDQWLRHLLEQDHDLWRSVLEQALADLVEGHLAKVDALLPREERDELPSLARYGADNLPESDRPLTHLAGLTFFPSPSAEHMPFWLGLADLLLTVSGSFRKSFDKNVGFPPGKGDAAVMKERMKALVERLSAVPGLEEALAVVPRLPNPGYPESQWRVLQALVELLPLAAAELWLVFRQESRCDFSAVAMRALDALGSVDDPSELLLQLDARIRHILVDEFQDTSYLQYHLLQNLTAGWQAGDGRTLFLVGDPMQSIYLFREAEVGLFLHARAHGLGSVPLERLDLCANFRSQKEIVDWVNDAFPKIFPDVEDVALGGVPYAASTAVHEPLPESACVVHPFAGRDDVAEAEVVAEVAEAALARHPEHTVAVLVRARSHLPDILRAFARRGLRFAARDIDLLEYRPVVRDLLAFTRALLHPADRLSWLCVLRAPWCGMSLADLAALCGDEKARTLPELLADSDVLQRLSTDGRMRVERLSGIMNLGRKRRGSIGLRGLVEGTWLALGGGACYDEAALKDAGQVFALLDECGRGGDLPDWGRLDEGVGRLFAAADTGADGCLQVMTIHKAKGLEFDTVILPGLGRKSPTGERPLLRWLEHPGHGLLLAPIAPRDGQGRDPIYDLIGRLEAHKEDLETVRLLYVATTRARQRLHLLGHAEVRSGESRPVSGSLLEKLWPVVYSHFVFPPADDDAVPEDAPERTPVPIRRLPVDWRMPLPQSVALPAVAAVSQPSRQLDEGSRPTIFSGWESETARHVGTVTHHYLERMAREGLDRWLPLRVDAEQTAAVRRLNRLGVPTAELESGWYKVRSALRGTMASERGRWILAPHAEGACELELSGQVNGQLVHAVVDRTFVEDDVRWIVDYKIVECREPMTRFLAGQGEKYRSQLLGYVDLLCLLEPERTIRAALYFPLFDGWLEIV